MGILSGVLTVRRFRVLGEVPEGFRESYRERLNAYAFREPPNEQGKQEIEGWAQVHNLLDTDFGDQNRWLYEPYALFALRIDKKVLPARWLRATVDKECERWCADRNQERCPPPVRAEIRDRVEQEWLRRILPQVRVAEVSWNMQEGFAVVQSLSEATLERVRRRFYQTFGLRLVPWSPLDWMEDLGTVEALVTATPAVLNLEAK
ncbi:MAG: recombination-associated protein RdgC [Deltaproteobacteria bacterium]|nr:recombination-associated protein RdgC [Deltaproteobacteria bacterium]MBW2253820.1 recombination-associated protein RdgC [Deltaproteobacteria bacterium]